MLRPALGVREDRQRRVQVPVRAVQGAAHGLRREAHAHELLLRCGLAYNQRKLGKPQILCFGFLLITPFHGFSRAFEGA